MLHTPDDVLFRGLAFRDRAHSKDQLRTIETIEVPRSLISKPDIRAGTNHHLIGKGPCRIRWRAQELRMKERAKGKTEVQINVKLVRHGGNRKGTRKRLCAFDLISLLVVFDRLE